MLSFALAFVCFCDFLFPDRMNQVYTTIVIKSLNAYAITHMLIRKCYTWLLVQVGKVYFPKNTISFIKNGCEVKDCDTGQLNDLIENPDKYDMILFKHYIRPDDNSGNMFKCNVIRLSTCINRNYLRLRLPPIISNIKFIDVRVSYNDKDYNIAFSSEYNYYIVGNVLFDKAFIKWHLNTYHLVVIDDDDDYICNILDNSVNFIQIDSSAHIVIGLNDYTIETKKELYNIDEVSETEL
jgi:hypothetical protein